MLVLILINWLVNSIWPERQLRHSLFFPFVLREKIASFRVYCSNKTQHWGQSVEFDLFRFIFIFVFGARGICIEFPMIDSENLKVWRHGDLFPAVTKSCAMDQKLWVFWLDYLVLSVSNVSLWDEEFLKLNFSGMCSKLWNLISKMYPRLELENRNQKFFRPANCSPKYLFCKPSPHSFTCVGLEFFCEIVRFSSRLFNWYTIRLQLRRSIAINFISSKAN